jgi:membrane-bound lytic murein transglycosylase F
MRKQTIIWIIAVLLVLVLLIWFGKTGSVRDLPEILEEGRMSVLIESGEHGFTRDSVHVYGFQYELIRRFTDSLGVELVVINEDKTRDGMRELTNGACDVLVSLRPVMIDSVRSVVSLNPILSTRLMLAQQTDSTGKLLISRQYELDGDTITVMKNSPFMVRLGYLAEELAINLTINDIAVDSPDEIVKLVNDKQIKYTICPEYLTGRFKARYADVDFSVPLSFKQDLTWTINRKSPELQKRLNAFLDGYIGTAEFVTLYNKYFSHSLTTNH